MSPTGTAWHVSKQVERALLDVPDERRVETGLRVARALIERLAELESLNAELAERPAGSGVHASRNVAAPAGRKCRGVRCRSSRCSTPRCSPTRRASRSSGTSSAPRSSPPIAIDVVMAFIRRSGIGPLLDALRAHCEDGRAAARAHDHVHRIDRAAGARRALASLGADVRVSYDLSTTRLHAKAWLFHRRSGFSTAYVGSSNLTHSAQVTGLEWNVRASARSQPGRRRQVRRRVRELLGERRLRPVRPRAVRRGASPSRRQRPRPAGDPQPDRARAPSRSRSGCSS